MEAKAQPDFIFVDTEQGLSAALVELSHHAMVAFDAEGVNLGREGSLTVISLRGVGATSLPAYVIDVKVLGARVFSESLPSLRNLLEDVNVTKVTFDCRMDSDALLNLFGVNLTTVFDLQVWDQAVRIERGETPPEVCAYFKNQREPKLKSMSAMTELYLSQRDVQKQPGPHKADSQVWDKRPLDSNSIKYAAYDVHVINALWLALQEFPLSKQLAAAARQHSERYATHYRALGSIDMKSMVDEIAIIDSASLAPGHPRRHGERPHEVKWDEAVALLLSCKRKDNNKAFNSVMFVLQHNDWYSDAGRRKIRELAVEYPHFSEKQRGNIKNPRSLVADHDSDDYFGGGFEDGYFGSCD